MSQFHFDPVTYLDMMLAEVPAYERFQDQVAAACAGERILELGTGSGETARRILDRLPAARLTGIDRSEPMLAAAAGALPAHRVDLHTQELEDPLPRGTFDLVVSALAIHHLDGPGKADLFRRIGAVLAPGGLFVLGDVVIPEDPADSVTPVDGVHDQPSTAADQTRWLEDAGFDVATTWRERDLVVLRATRR